MNNLFSTSCGKDNRDGGISPIILILLLSCLCGGDGGLFGGLGGGNDCGNNGLEGILPILLILCLCGGSF